MVDCEPTNRLEDEDDDEYSLPDEALALSLAALRLSEIGRTKRRAALTGRDLRPVSLSFLNKT
jgi:hypothetical protein